MSHANQMIASLRRLIRGVMLVKTWRQVGLLFTLIVGLAALAPSGGAFIIIQAIPFAPPGTALAVALSIMVIAVIIAAPIAIFALYILLMLNRTIDKVDASVRFDHLTGVYTRAAFLSLFHEGLRSGGCLLMLDADHFKAVNDRFGHHIGDAALKVMSAAMRMSLDADQAIGRLGGEEFAVFLPGATNADALIAAERIRQAVEVMGREIEGIAVELTVSIGLTRCQATQSANLAMQQADRLLYEAKRQGRNRIVDDLPEDGWTPSSAPRDALSAETCPNAEHPFSGSRAA